MPSAVRAHTTATSATDPLVIQVFSPFKTHRRRPCGRGPHPRRIRAEIRLGETEAADRFAGLQLAAASAPSVPPNRK